MNSKGQTGAVLLMFVLAIITYYVPGYIALSNIVEPHGRAMFNLAMFAYFIPHTMASLVTMWSGLRDLPTRGISFKKRKRPIRLNTKEDKNNGSLILAILLFIFVISYVALPVYYYTHIEKSNILAVIPFIMHFFVIYGIFSMARPVSSQS
jgi:hypothetical protein